MNTDRRQRYGSTTVDVADAELTPEQIVRLTRLGRELRLVDQILSTDVDKVQIVSKGPAPAWSSLEGDKVSFAATRMPDPVDRYDLAVWLGTNAHELGHVLYSPRRESPLMQRVIAGSDSYLEGLARMHNIVEDQRQERLILARFAPWRGYLVAALGHHLHADNDSAWLLMAGRTWLPEATRAKARAHFVAHRSEAVAVEVAELIGQYQRLTDPGWTDSDEAWDVLIALHSLFDNEIPEGIGCTIMEGGEPSTDPADADGAPVTADEAEAERQAEAGGEGAEDAGDDGGDPGDARSQGTPNRDSKPDDSRDDAADAGSQGKGAGTQSAPPSKREQRDALRDELRDAAESQIDEDDDSLDELDSILDALDHGRAADDVDGTPAEGHYVEATDHARQLHREIGEVLLDFKDATEPGWNKRTDSGRLNVRRLLDPFADADTLFDRYEPGQMDATALEVVLLLDISGSMAQDVDDLAEATWAIRQAVDDVEGTITVLTYDTRQYVLAAPGERPDDRMFVPAAMGGTDPTSAIGEAWQILAGSEARNKLLIIMTDGSWSYSQRPEELIDAMRRYGVATIMAFLPPKYGDNGETPMHHCEFGGRIASLVELPRLFQHVALRQMQRVWL
jgi:hypothetical protein